MAPRNPLFHVIRVTRLVLSGAFFCCVLGVVAYYAFRDSGEPSKVHPNQQGASIRLEKEEINLGDIILEDIGKPRKIAFRNVGRELLEIISVKSSCQCTVGKIKKSLLKPNELGELEYVSDSKRHFGPFVDLFTINTNDPVRPQIIVRFKGNVVPPTIMHPANIDLGCIGQGRTFKRTVTIEPRRYSLSTKGAKIEKIGIKCKAVSHVNLETAGRSTTATIVGEVPPVKGGIDGSVFFWSQGYEFPLHQLYVSGSTFKGLFCAPDYILFGKVPVGGTAKRTFYVGSSSEIDIASIKVHSVNGTIRTEQKYHEEEGRYEIVVSWNPLTKKDVLHDKVHVEVSCDKEVKREFVVSCSGWPI